MTTQQYLAFDLGAESGRGILGAFDGERVTLRELGRFATGQGERDLGADGVRRWDWPRIVGEIQTLLRQAQAETNGTLAGVGADSWGVDFGLLDSRGLLLETPRHYRDDANPAAMAWLQTVIPKEELWVATGIQPLAFNTIAQLAAIQKSAPDLLEQAAHLLLIPDLIHHTLTEGASASVERTNGSTTQLMQPGAGAWQTSLLDRLGVPTQFLGPLTDAGSFAGRTAGGTPVYAPATHDTASAVAAVPFAPDGHGLFLSSGTWSLLGAELPAPLLSLEALYAGFSNEGGVAGTTRFLKNIMGLWLVQECRRSLTRQTGREYSYAELTALASAAPAGGPLIDATNERFLAPTDMAAEIRAACDESEQAPLQDVGALIRCCLESLALAYRQARTQIETLTGRTFDTLHIVGGGSQNRVLNQWAADACGLPVIAGPSEVTAMGNILGQMVGSGAVQDWAEARTISRRSAAPEIHAVSGGARPLERTCSALGATQGESKMTNWDAEYALLRRRLEDSGVDVAAAEAQLAQQRVETPSWGYADGGTRFGVFRQPGAPRSVRDKFEDAAQAQKYTGIAPGVAVHIPWDTGDDWNDLAAYAASLGVHIGAVNPNVFQDYEYRFGSLANSEPAVRKKAIAHILECVEIMRVVGSTALSLWFADGTNFPGQGDMRARKRHFQEGLGEVYQALSAGQTMLVEYKPFEPSFYHTDIADWGMAYAFCRHLGPQAKVLVDLGHHLPGANIEHIVAFLLDEGRLGGFHFNNRKYADDDLTTGSINPYELFLIYTELAAGERDGIASDVAYMIDESHTLKNKTAEMIQSLVALQTSYAKALIVDWNALAQAREAQDLIRAEEVFKSAYATDVRPLLWKVRTDMNLPNPADPLLGFLNSGYVEEKAKERGIGGTSGLGA